jgi:beta-galactosidase
VNKQRGPDAAPLNINEMMAAGGLNDKMVVSDLVTEKTAESYGVLDIAGMNYSDARYAMDRDVIVPIVRARWATTPTG